MNNAAGQHDGGGNLEEMNVKDNKTNIRNTIQETLSKAKAIAFLIGHAPAETLRDHLEGATALHSDLIEEVERNVELLANCKE